MIVRWPHDYVWSLMIVRWPHDYVWSLWWLWDGPMTMFEVCGDCEIAPRLRLKSAMIVRWPHDYVWSLMIVRWPHDYVWSLWWLWDGPMTMKSVMIVRWPHDYVWSLWWLWDGPMTVWSLRWLWTSLGLLPGEMLTPVAAAANSIGHDHLPYSAFSWERL